MAAMAHGMDCFGKEAKDSFDFGRDWEGVRIGVTPTCCRVCGGGVDLGEGREEGA
jgi:hypothetical protein